MPNVTLTPNKKYYTIGEAAQHFGVATSLIRFWEKKFPALRPTKNDQGTRRYTKNDLELLQRIYDLVKKQGYTLQGAQDFLKTQQKKPPAHQETIATLRDIKAFLLTLQDQLK